MLVRLSKISLLVLLRIKILNVGLRSVEESDEDWERGQQEAANLSATINGILGSYDRKLRPNAGGECLPSCSFTFGANTYENEGK